MSPRGLLTGGLLLALVPLAGCPTTQVRPATSVPASGTAVSDAQHLAQDLGAGSALTARTTIIVHRINPDDATFDVAWWVAAPGRLRVEASAHDVVFCKATLDQHQAYLAALPRDQVVTSGRLGAAPSTPWLLTALQLAASELLQGPIDPNLPMTQGATAGSVHVALPRGLTAEVTVGAGELAFTAKHISGPDGAELVAITYARYRAYDELRRPSVLTMAFPDGSSATLYLRKFQSVGRFSDGALHLDADPAWASIDLTDFLARLEHQGNG